MHKYFLTTYRYNVNQRTNSSEIMHFAKTRPTCIYYGFAIAGIKYARAPKVVIHRLFLVFWLYRRQFICRSYSPIFFSSLFYQSSLPDVTAAPAAIARVFVSRRFAATCPFTNTWVWSRLLAFKPLWFAVIVKGDIKMAKKNRTRGARQRRQKQRPPKSASAAAGGRRDCGRSGGCYAGGIQPARRCVYSIGFGNPLWWPSQVLVYRRLSPAWRSRGASDGGGVCQFCLSRLRTFHSESLDAVLERVRSGQILLIYIRLQTGSIPKPPGAARTALCAGQQGCSGRCAMCSSPGIPAIGEYSLLAKSAAGWRECAWSEQRRLYVLLQLGVDLEHLDGRPKRRRRLNADHPGQWRVSRRITGGRNPFDSPTCCRR